MDDFSAARLRIGQRVGHRNMLHLIQLRWLAVLGQAITIVFVSLILGVELPMLELWTVLAFLIAFNIGSHLLWHEQPLVSNRELTLALLVDIVALTLQLHFSGGMSNPFVFLYLQQVILGVILLEVSSAWIIVFVTCLCMLGLTLFSDPLHLYLPDDAGVRGSTLYARGLLVCFVLNATLLVIFIGQIIRNVRTADDKLARARQRAAEEEHVVRMGLLATGAAHELGTPLATLSVIMNDWQRLPEFADSSELQGELADMQVALARCKRIVSGILLAAGEARGESSSKTTLWTFLNEVVQEWQEVKNSRHFVFHNHIVEDQAVIFDSTLKQMLFNLLDNAAEACPEWVEMQAQVQGNDLILIVQDQGPGFPDYMLQHIGKPYQSTKGRAGGGLGLFLVVNVARTLGGGVQVINRSQGGAQVRVSLPLASLRYGETIK